MRVYKGSLGVFKGLSLKNFQAPPNGSVDCSSVWLYKTDRTAVWSLRNWTVGLLESLGSKSPREYLVTQVIKVGLWKPQKTNLSNVSRRQTRQITTPPISSPISRRNIIPTVVLLQIPSTHSEPPSVHPHNASSSLPRAVTRLCPLH